LILVYIFKCQQDIFTIVKRFQMNKNIKWQSVAVQMLFRIALLIILLLGVYLLMLFTYDPHKRCVGDDHHHTMGPIGYVILAVAIAIFWCIAIVVELISRYFSKDQR